MEASVTAETDDEDGIDEDPQTKAAEKVLFFFFLGVISSVGKKYLHANSTCF